MFKRFTVGSVANALRTHAAAIPVALAPRGYQRDGAAYRVDRVHRERRVPRPRGTSPSQLASRRGLQLRLVSLVSLDTQRILDSGEAIHSAHLHANSVLAQAATELPPGKATVTGAWTNIEEAIHSLDWDEGELVVMGSSRLAQHNRLFLGATATRSSAHCRCPWRWSRGKSTG